MYSVHVFKNDDVSSLKVQQDDVIVVKLVHLLVGHVRSETLTCK